MKIERHGATIESHSEDTATVRTAGGGVMDIDKDGNVNLNLQSIEAVGIHNLMEVEAYDIVRIAGSVSNHVRFHGGGEVRFVYNNKAELIELSAEKCAFSVSNSTELIFRRERKKEG